MSDCMQRRRRVSIRGGKWLFCVVIAVCAIAASWWPQGLLHLRYERAGLMAGEEWRAVTAHFVHLNAAHLLFNLVGLFLLCELLWADMPLRHGFGLLIWSALGVSAMLWWLHPELGWYAGLSGALHGLWAGCALAGASDANARGVVPPAVVDEHKLRERWPKQEGIGAAALVLLAIKLTSEAFFGVSPVTAQAIGGSVITVAHSYGALAGIFYLLLWRGIGALRVESRAGR